MGVKKIFLVVLGISIFVLIGFGTYYSGIEFKSRPEIPVAFKFAKGFSADKLELSDHEVASLIRCYYKNRLILGEASLVVEPETSSDKSATCPSCELIFKVELTSKCGIKYMPNVEACKRKALVGKIISIVNVGSEVLKKYSEEKSLSGKDIQIINS